MLHDIHLASISLTLGDELTTDDALAAGQITPADVAADSAPLAVRILPKDRSLTEVLTATISDAIVSSPAGQRRGELGPVYHAASTRSGITAAAVMASGHPLVARDHPAVTIDNGAQSVVDGLRSAALYFTSSRDTAATFALVTAADVWRCEPYMRWRMNGASDGAGAIVLSTERGPLRLVATCTYVNPELDGIRFKPDAVEHVSDTVGAVILELLDEARLPSADVRFLVSPLSSAYFTAATHFLPGLHPSEHARHDDRARQLGTLGSVDLIADLHALTHADRLLTAGDHILILTGDGDTSIGAALLEVQAEADR